MQGNVGTMLRKGRFRLRGREDLFNVGKQFVGVLRIRQQTPLLSLIKKVRVRHAKASIQPSRDTTGC
jgi:hypothetical protein